jgi:hypothetical protein
MRAKVVSHSKNNTVLWRNPKDSYDERLEGEGKGAKTIEGVVKQWSYSSICCHFYEVLHHCMKWHQRILEEMKCAAGDRAHSLTWRLMQAFKNGVLIT